MADGGEWDGRHHVAPPNSAPGARPRPLPERTVPAHRARSRVDMSPPASMASARRGDSLARLDIMSRQHRSDPMASGWRETPTRSLSAAAASRRSPASGRSISRLREVMALRRGPSTGLTTEDEFSPPKHEETTVKSLALKRRERLRPPPPVQRSQQQVGRGNRTRKEPRRRPAPSEALGGLCLDITPRGEEQSSPVEQEDYRFSESGAFVIDEFEIGPAGLRCNASSPLQPSGHKTNEEVSPTGTPSEKRGLGDDLIHLGILGTGACSTVFKALHVPTLRIVAQKVIPIFDEHKRRQMLRELRSLYRMANNSGESQDEELLKRRKHIVDFYDAFIDARDGSVSVLVEYMDGGSLQDVVDAGGCPHESVLANVAWRILSGLTYLHDGRHQMHRDIKPANLLISHNGDVKIGDFGIAREFHNETASFTEKNAMTFVGTVTYMSPERLLGEPYDCKADIWALGITLMTCALGEFPYSKQASQGGFWGLLQALREEPPPELPAKIFSEEARHFVRRCMSRQPEQRPSAAELLRHPFLAKCGDVTTSPSMRRRSTDEEDDLVPETVALELEQIIAALKQHYRARWDAQEDADFGPIADKPRLLALARQLGAPERYVRQRFAQMAKELRGGLNEPL